MLRACRDSIAYRSRPPRFHRRSSMRFRASGWSGRCVLTNASSLALAGVQRVETAGEDLAGGHGGQFRGRFRQRRPSERASARSRKVPRVYGEGCIVSILLMEPTICASGRRSGAGLCAKGPGRRRERTQHFGPWRHPLEPTERIARMNTVSALPPGNRISSTSEKSSSVTWPGPFVLSPDRGAPRQRLRPSDAERRR